MMKRFLCLLLAAGALTGCVERLSPAEKEARALAQALREAQVEEANLQREKIQAYFRSLKVAKVCPSDPNGYRIFIYQDAARVQLWISPYRDATESNSFEPVAPGVTLKEVC